MNAAHYNEELIDRIRMFLQDAPKVDEKKMFHLHAFMVNDKLCVAVGKEEVLFRIHPASYESLLEKPGVRSFEIKGREGKGYVYVNEMSLQSNHELSEWIQLALDYNGEAKSSKKKK